MTRLLWRALAVGGSVAWACGRLPAEPLAWAVFCEGADGLGFDRVERNLTFNEARALHHELEALRGLDCFVRPDR